MLSSRDWLTIMPTRVHRRRTRRTPTSVARYAPPYATTGAKLGRAVLGYLVLVVLVVTLAPFTFRVPDAIHLTYWTPDGPWYGAFDPIANVALFAPLGFVYALTRATVAPESRYTLARAWTLGLLLSVAIETTQLFIPTRYTSPVDVLTNALGALVGAWLHRKIARRLRADRVLAGGLALELPVMGLVYVALPLVTLAALTVARGPGVELVFPPRPAGLIALALFGATLLGTVQRRRTPTPKLMTSAPTVAEFARARSAGAAGALWFGVGALPALATAPRAFAIGLVAAAVVAALVSTSHIGQASDERRFEGEAIGRAAPFLALSLALFPFGQEIPGPQLSDGDIIRMLEGLCGFAVVGYLLAEAWGRREMRYRHSVQRVAGTAAVAAVAQALLAHGSEVAADPALVEIAARVLCAAYGGWIYHLQRAHVRVLVEARTVHGTAVRRRVEWGGGVASGVG